MLFVMDLCCRHYFSWINLIEGCCLACWWDWAEWAWSSSSEYIWLSWVKGCISWADCFEVNTRTISYSWSSVAKCTTHGMFGPYMRGCTKQPISYIELDILQDIGPICNHLDSYCMVGEIYSKKKGKIVTEGMHHYICTMQTCRITS